MQALISFFKGSIYSPAFYERVFSEKFSFSIKYFFSLVTVLALCITIVFSFKLVPIVRGFFQNLGPTVIGNFPNDLSITVKSGVVSVNQPEPYKVPIPESLKPTLAAREGDIQNIVVIDTKAPLSVDKFQNYHTLILVSADSAMSRDDQGKITIQKLPASANATIDKAWVANVVDIVLSLSGWVAPIMVIGIFSGFFILFSLNLIYLFFAALLVWLVLRAKNVPGRYGKAYQVGIHAMTLSLLVTAINYCFWPPLQLPYLFTALLLATVVMNVKSRPKTPIPIAQ